MKKCFPRKRFSTKDAALTAARSIAVRQSMQRYAEPCQHCNGWHLSADQFNKKVAN